MRRAVGNTADRIAPAPVWLWLVVRGLAYHWRIIHSSCGEWMNSRCAGAHVKRWHIVLCGAMFTVIAPRVSAKLYAVIPSTPGSVLLHHCRYVVSSSCRSPTAIMTVQKFADNERW